MNKDNFMYKIKCNKRMPGKYLLLENNKVVLSANYNDCLEEFNSIKTEHKIESTFKFWIEKIRQERKLAKKALAEMKMNPTNWKSYFEKYQIHTKRMIEAERISRESKRFGASISTENMPDYYFK